MSHRTPPLPPTFCSVPKPGLCRWCGGDIKKADGSLNKRRRWHNACLDTYLSVSRPEVAKQNLRKFERDICQMCGKKTTNWHLDHIVPLWKVVHFSDEIRIKFFQIGNLQTLCRPCHREKTGRESKERATLKKKGGELLLLTPPLDSLKLGQLCLHI